MANGGSVTRRHSPEEFAHRVNLGLFKGVSAWAALVSQRAENNAPVKTGRLARSIHPSETIQVAEAIFSADVGVFRAQSGTVVEYAAAQEFGSGLYAEDPARSKSGGQKYPIRAKYAKSLAFEWPGGPTTHPAYDPQTGLFFFKQIMHPGVHPQPYLRPALKDSKNDGPRLAINSVVAELVRP